MEFTLGQLAQLLGGKIFGDENLKVNSIGKIESAQPNEVSFLSNLKYEPYLYKTNAAAVIVSEGFEPKEKHNCALIFVKDAYSALGQILEQYEKMLQVQKTGKEEFAFASSTAKIGENVYQAAFSYIGENCKIGNNVKLYPHTFIGDNTTIGDNTIVYSGVKIYHNTIIGQFCTLHAGAIIGSDGFGFAPQSDGSYKNVPQIGNVILEDFVSIGANTTVDRATMGSTIIRKGVKLDNLVQIAHNVEVGENTVMAAQVAIAGSTKIGKNNVFGGQVGIGGHISIADGTKLGAKSGVIKEIKEEGQALLGGPAIPVKEFFKLYAIYKNLPNILKRLAELEEKTVNLAKY